MHGHTWKFEVGLEADELDAEGFVVDFGLLKRSVLKPCHALLDHSLAMGEQTYADVGTDLVGVGKGLLGSRAEVHAQADTTGPTDDPDAATLNGARNRYPGGMKVAVFPFSPTSERLARWLYELATTLEDGRVKVSYARIYETLRPVEAVAEYLP